MLSLIFYVSVSTCISICKYELIPNWKETNTLKYFGYCSRDRGGSTLLQCGFKSDNDDGPISHFHSFS